MAYKALYRKYRPETFSSVVGQEHITATLKNELALGKVFHAYLFTGTRGTGKTSCAKILARAVNCLSPVNGDPCGECEACKAILSGENTDVAEIDAASNNGVDDIRNLRDQINFVPAASKYRVYIIDEVHMLSESAFNALLKTLEEPPAHVVFVLATTEVYKLPATILSRCQRFDFRRIDVNDIESRIKYVAQSEGINITDDAAFLIASAADGGMRDALSLLDLCVSAGNDITEDTVITACGMAGRESLFKLADAIKSRDAEAALKLIDNLYSSGKDMLRLLNDLTEHYRNLMIFKTVESENKPVVCSAADTVLFKKQAKEYKLADIMDILKYLQTAFAGMQNGNRRLQMEMVLIKLCTAAFEGTENTVQVLKEPAPVVTESAPAPLNDGLLSSWQDILGVLRTVCPPALSVLDGSKAYIQGDLLLIDAPNPLFKDMVNSNASIRNGIKKAAEQVLHRSFRLGPYKKSESAVNEDPLKALANKLKSLETDGGN